MKRIILYLIIFIIFTSLIISCPIITNWDRSIIISIQNLLKDLPIIIPMLPDCKLYSIMITLPLVIGSIFFIRNKKYLDIIFLLSIPLLTFIINCILKPLIHRARPPFELQISTIHPDSFSYVSSHSLVTFCLWAFVIYYTNKYIKNKITKNIIIIISVLWILFVGFSRIWLGVHNFTDVLGAYILGFILFELYQNLRKILCKKF